MRDFAQSAQATQETLGNFHQTLQDYIAEQRRNQQNGEIGACLKHMFVTDPQAQMATKLSTNDQLIPESYTWILRTEEYQALQDWGSSAQILWLFGPAGTGKTMLNIGIISEMFEQSSNITASISYYFCEARGENQSRAMDVLRTLIWGLVIQQPHLFSHLQDVYKSSGEALFTAPNAFWHVRDKFLAMLADERLTPVYLVIDALDECESNESKSDEPGVQDLIDMVSSSLELPNSSAKIKWLLSSRPEIDLPNRLTEDKLEALKQVDVQSHPEPVDAYITYKLDQLKSRLKYKDEILKEVGSEIRQRAQNTFLWVALVFKDLLHRRVKDYAAMKEIQKIPGDLSELYDRMMVRIDNGPDPDLTKSVLEAACFASRPLSYAEVHVLSGLPTGYPAEDFVSSCGSFLNVDNGAVHVLHNSARQHLMDYFEPRATEIRQLMFDRSLAALSDGLKRNIYDLPPGTESSDIVVPETDPLARLAYSCENWVNLLPSTAPVADDGPLLAFFRVHFLHWLESLSLLGKLSKAIVVIRDLRTRIKIGDVVTTLMRRNPQVRTISHHSHSSFNTNSNQSGTGTSKTQELSAFVNDAERFTMKNLAVMMQFPLEIYESALLFSPSNSIIKKTFFDGRTPSVSRFAGGVEHWDLCRQTLDRGAGTQALAFSRKGKSFASALFTDDKIIAKIWDASIGDCFQIMEINEKEQDALFLAFTPDSNQLVVASKDKLRLMDVKTGACRHTINLPDAKISSIAFSPDGKHFAVAFDCTVQVWDTSNWTYTRTLEGHTEPVKSVVFAPDSESLATCAAYDTIRTWNRIDGPCKAVIDRGYIMPERVSFSPDGSEIISHGIYLQIYDAADGTLKAKYDTDTGDDTLLLPDGKATAIARTLGNVVLQDLATGEFIRTCYQDGEGTQCVAFSQATGVLLSSASSGSIRVWDLSSPPTKSSDSHEEKISILRFSPDGALLATGSKDKTIKLWSPTNCNLEHTLGGHDDGIEFLAFAPDGKSLVSLSARTARIWDTVSGTCKHAFTIMSGESEMAKLGKMEKIMSALQGKDGDEDLDELDFDFNKEPQPYRAQVATFSPDGGTLAVEAGLGRVTMWDTTTAECKQVLQGDPSAIRWLWFLRDGRELLMGGMVGVELWDIETGTSKLKITELMSALCLSSDGATLVSGSNKESLRVWDVASGDCRQTVPVGHTIESLAFTENGKYLKADSQVFAFSSGVLASTPDPEPSGSVIQVDEPWVTRDGKKLFTLPPDFPPSLMETHKNTIALGGISGEVAVLEIDR